MVYDVMEVEDEDVCTYNITLGHLLGPSLVLLWDKFSLDFELMSRGAVEASRTGNPFLEKNLLVARVDQLARAEDLTAKVQVSDWDLYEHA